MDGCKDGWMDGWMVDMDGWMHGWMDRQMDGWIDGWRWIDGSLDEQIGESCFSFLAFDDGADDEDRDIKI